VVSPEKTVMLFESKSGKDLSGESEILQARHGYGSISTSLMDMNHGGMRTCCGN